MEKIEPECKVGAGSYTNVVSMDRLSSIEKREK
jgi:hypothetical protein